MKRETKPINCTKCKTLALAYFEGEPLCPNCLVAAVLSSKDPFAVDRIKPLHPVDGRLKGLVKCGQDSKFAMTGEGTFSGTGGASYLL